VLQNKLTKLGILGIGLLLGIGYGEVMATNFSGRNALQLEAKQIINVLEIVKSKDSSEEQRRQAGEFLYLKGIVYRALYTPENVERVRNGEGCRWRKVLFALTKQYAIKQVANPNNLALRVP
jgi:hypothetical protein